MEADRLESQALLRVRQLGGGKDMDMGMSMEMEMGEMGSQKKEYPLYESLEQFMKKQFEIKVRQRGKDKTGKENGQTGLGMVKSVN